MKDFSSFFLLIVVITIFYLYLESKASEVTYVTADNGKKYLVRNLPDKVDAANLLSKVQYTLTTLVDHLYENREKKYSEKKEDIERMKENYRPDSLSESSPGNKYTSYSINKGSKIVYCIRSKDGKNTLVDENTIKFVAIHELAHLMTKEIGHVPIFWENMRYLLKQAIDLKLYKYQDYSEKHVEYCGTHITDTPL